MGWVGPRFGSSWTLTMTPPEAGGLQLCPAVSGLGRVSTHRHSCVSESAPRARRAVRLLYPPLPSQQTAISRNHSEGRKSSPEANRCSDKEQPSVPSQSPLGVNADEPSSRDGSGPPALTTGRGGRELSVLSHQPSHRFLGARPGPCREGGTHRSLE